MQWPTGRPQAVLGGLDDRVVDLAPPPTRAASAGCPTLTPETVAYHLDPSRTRRRGGVTPAPATPIWGSVV
ncbi:Uncharacterised protein [Mycobacteroides abscessus]|nr:Uncharacterised protein [Mycobacteroides abscessus]